MGLGDGAELVLTVMGIGGGVWRLRLGKGWGRWKRTRDRGGGGKGKTAENRRARRERRYGRRRERRAGRGGVGYLAGEGSVVRGAVMIMMLMTVVTWNLQRVSLREQNRGRLRKVTEWVKQRGWEVVLVTELLGRGRG